MKKTWLDHDHPARPSNLNRPTRPLARPPAKPSWMETQSSLNHPSWLDHSSTTESKDMGWFVWVLVPVAFGIILFCVYYCILRPIRFLAKLLCGWCESSSTIQPTEQQTAVRTVTCQLPPPTTEQPILTNYQVTKLQAKLQHTKRKYNELKRNQVCPEDSSPSNETESNGHDCSICFMDMRADDRYQVAFNPCGHSCCNDCSTRLNECHVCRLNISTKIRLY